MEKDKIIKLKELCDEYCESCPVTHGQPNPNDCTGCIVTYIRGIIDDTKQ